MSKRLYLAVIVVLLIHFFVRAHHPLELPFFWDEHRHITRAAAIMDGGHPAENSHGKFLLYVWLAPFNPDITVALHVSRTAVALFSLLGVSALFALTRRLFGMQAAFIAIAFYAIAPFALFYERMVLADSLAAALGTVAAWQGVRLAYRPTYKTAIMMGAMASLAVMAKLTMTFSVVLMPVLAAFLLGTHSGVHRTGREWFVLRWRRYWWYWFTAGVTFVVLWLPILIPAAIVAVTSGDYYVLVDSSLVDRDASGAVERFSEFYHQITTMLSWPLAVGLVGAAVWLVRRSPGRGLFLLLWLLLIWVPSLILVWRTQSRYLMPGMYPLAILLAGAMTSLAAIKPDVRQQVAVRFGTVVILLVWAVLFAVPFAVNASTNVADIRLTRWDNRDYFQAPWNGWALLQAHQYLEDHGIPGPDGNIRVLNVNWMCQQMELYAFEDMERECVIKEYNSEIGTPAWQQIVEQAIGADYPLYLVLEQHRKTFEIPQHDPYPHPDLRWQRIAAYQRPKGGLWVTVWRVDHRP